LLRAPTLLHDYHTLENAIGGRLSHTSETGEPIIPSPARIWCYRFALERGYFDSLLNEYFVVPFRALFQSCDALERRWTDWLSGGHSRAFDDVEIHSEIVEELRS
jgi:NAD(P)H-quinone oxidoreductase subunit 5